MATETNPFANLHQPFSTPFGNETDKKNYLMGQTAFSTTLGFVVCRLPFLQSAALGVATEICRYVTDKAVAYLSNEFSHISNYQTTVKTVLVAGSFFLTNIAINAVLPNSFGFMASSLLMTATYLAGEPIAKRASEAWNADKPLKQCFIDIQNDLCEKYGPTIETVQAKITTIWNSFGGNRNAVDPKNVVDPKNNTD